MDLESLEMELRALRPAAPSETLARKVAETTGNTPEVPVVFFPEAASLRRRIRRWQAGAAITGGLAACLALVLLARSHQESPAGNGSPAALAATVTTPAVSPDSVEKPRTKLTDPVRVAPPAAPLVMLGREGRFQSAQPEGWLNQQDGSRSRIMRVRYLDSVRWQDPQDQSAVIETTLPRERIVQLPSAENETY